MLPRANAPRVVYHGTSTEYLDGFETGATDDLLYLTTSKANAWEYAQEKADEVGGSPVVLLFDLDVLARSGALAPDWKWLPKRAAFRTVSWEECLDETGHVTFEGTFSTAILRS